MRGRCWQLSPLSLAIQRLRLLAHGAARADTPERKIKRLEFIEHLSLALPIYPVTAAIALRAGQIDGENRARGVRLSLSDLLIGVTALELGYSVATGNIRHFN